MVLQGSIANFLRAKGANTGMISDMVTDESSSKIKGLSAFPTYKGVGLLGLRLVFRWSRLERGLELGRIRLEIGFGRGLLQKFRDVNEKGKIGKKEQEGNGPLSEG